MSWLVGGLAWLISTALFQELRAWYLRNWMVTCGLQLLVLSPMRWQVFVIPLVAGAVGLASSLLMSRERLFGKMKFGSLYGM